MIMVMFNLFFVVILFINNHVSSAQQYIFKANYNNVQQLVCKSWK